MDENKVEQKAVKEGEKKANEAPSKNEKPSKEDNQSQEDPTSTPYCYDSPLGYVVTITPPLPDGNNVIEYNNSSPPRLTLSPIRHAFPKRFLQSTTTIPHRSKPSKSIHLAKDGNTAIAVVEYDKLFEATGGTYVAILANQFQPRIVDTYEYDPSQAEESTEPHPPSDSKGKQVRQ